MTAQIEYDKFHDEYYLVIPEDMMDELGWELGDTLVWTIYENKVSLRKYQPDTPKTLIEEK
jgi:bifunctional DNA-binding transcriptional regulator/antitoxin component of YhaV-PrlF toxin-antitoxin module